MKKYIGLNVGIDFNFATVSHQCCQMVKGRLKYYHSPMQSCTWLPLELSWYVYFLDLLEKETDIWVYSSSRNVCIYIPNQAVHYFRTIEITKSYLATLQQPSQASSGIHTPNHHNLPIIRLVLQHLVASRPSYIQEQTSHTYYAFLLNIKIGSTHILRHFVIQIVGNSIHEKAPALLNVRNPLFDSTCNSGKTYE